MLKIGPNYMHTGSGLGDSSVFRINQSKNKKRKQSYDISCI
jgi:hypothetical protein